MTKKNFKITAIQLRNNGYSYSEILKNVSVSKSTLSLWLRGVDLSKRQKERITLKKIKASWQGGEMKRLDRLKRTKEIIENSTNEIKTINKKQLLLMGVMLYWAEGSKEKTYKPGTGVIFSNSDPMMIKIYLKWLKECLLISEDRLVFEIYVHETYKKDINDLRRFWSEITNLPISFFNKIYFKKNKVKGNRKNKGIDYQGLLRIKVKKSSFFNRKITGWIAGVCKQCGIV